MFASLLGFFTHDWGLSLKHIFEAEWGVFAALTFRLNPNTLQVSFHFKRFMKVLEKNPLLYLGSEMYSQWQQALREDLLREERREKRRERRRRIKERKVMKLQREFQQQSVERLSSLSMTTPPRRSSP